MIAHAPALVNLCSMLLLLTSFAIVAQRRLSACVDLFALQSVFIALRDSLPALAALHPVNALAIFYVAQLTARGASAVIPGQARSVEAAAEPVRS